MSGHLKAQLLRFARISALAFLAALPTTSSLSWSSLLALGAGSLEVGLRQLNQVKPVPDVTAVLAPPDKGGAP